MTRRGSLPLQAMARSKKGTGRVYVACRRHVRIGDLAAAIDGAIDVMPVPANARVGLVHAPVWANPVAVIACYLVEQRQVVLHPAVDGALIDQDAAFGQQFTDLDVAESVARGQGDDVVWKPATGERGTRRSSEAPPAAATSEPLPNEFCNSVFVTASELHRGQDTDSSFCCQPNRPHSPAREPLLPNADPPPAQWLDSEEVRVLREDCGCTARYSSTELRT
jgi:hypothetical protein